MGMAIIAAVLFVIAVLMDDANSGSQNVYITATKDITGRPAHDPSAPMSTLSCVGCGAPLPGDPEHVVCGYCGRVYLRGRS